MRLSSKDGDIMRLSSENGKSVHNAVILTAFGKSRYIQTFRLSLFGKKNIVKNKTNNALNGVEIRREPLISITRKSQVHQQ